MKTTKINKKTKDKVKVITYSSIERANNGLKSPLGMLIFCIEIYAFIPFIMVMIKKFNLGIEISNSTYTKVLIMEAVVIFVGFIYKIAKWVKQLLTVFIIDDGKLYTLRISMFWYKVRDKMYLINPTGLHQGRMLRFMYMINNIRLVFDSAAEDINFEEFVSMGKMHELLEIKNVTIKDKRISFKSTIKSNGEKKTSTIKIDRIFDKDKAFCNYLKTYEKDGVKEAAKVDFSGVTYLKKLIFTKENYVGNQIEKLKRNSFFWVCMTMWFLILATYKNVFIMMCMIYAIYLVSWIVDMTPMVIEKKLKDHSVVNCEEDDSK